MAFCSNCGNALGEGQRFCGSCGQAVGTAATAQSAAAASPPPPPPAQGAAYLQPPAYQQPTAYQQPPAYAPPPGGHYGQPTSGGTPRRSRKGLWIGLASGLLVVVVACVLVFVVFRGDIFGDDSTASISFGGEEFNLSDKSTPSEIMAALMTNAGSAETVTGTFDLKVDIEADTSGMSSEEASMLSDPLTLSGTMAADKAQQAGDFDISLGMMGSTMDVALKVVGGQAWIGLKDQWYEAPADTGIDFQNGQVTDSLDQLQSALSGISVDPANWLKNQAPVKEEKLDGAKVLHISGSDPDWAALVADLAKVMMNPEVQSLMDSSDSGASSLQDQLPSAEELLRLGTQLDSIFQNVQIDLWVDEEHAVLRKVTIVCDIVPPADMSSLGDPEALGGMDLSGSGISKMSIDATITLNPFKKVEVEAPKNAKTADQLQTDLEADPSLLGPLGQLLMGMSQ